MNIARNFIKYEHSEPFEPADFNPIPVPGESVKEPKKPQTPEEMAYVAKMLVAAMGGKIQ
jgi:hypothetical protein